MLRGEVGESIVARMTKLMAAVLLLGTGATAIASDIINQDKKAYTVTVVDGGYTAKYTVKAGSTQYGVCTSGPCTFKIAGSSVTATKNDKVVIKNGKIAKQ
jgi:hypothetical protein